MIVIKGMAIGTKIAVDLGTEMEGIEAAPGRVPNPGVVPKTDMRVEGRVEKTTENRDRSESRFRSSSHVSTN